MWPKGRDPLEAAFQTASLGQVSSLQSYDREGKSTKHSHEQAMAVKAYLLNYINLQKHQDDVWQVHGDTKDFSSSVDDDWAQGVMFSMAGTRCSSASLKEINGGRQ